MEKEERTRDGMKMEQGQKQEEQTNQEYIKPAEQITELAESYDELTERLHNQVREWGNCANIIDEKGKTVELRLSDDDSIEVAFSTEEGYEASFSANSVKATPFYTGKVNLDLINSNVGIEFEANNQKMRVPLNGFSEGNAFDLNPEGMVYAQELVRKDDEVSCTITFRSKGLADICRQAYEVLERLGGEKRE